MLMYGDTIKKTVIKIKQIFTKKQKFSKSLHMEQLSCRIPDVAFNYKEFREPLVELD